MAVNDALSLVSISLHYEVILLYLCPRAAFFLTVLRHIVARMR